MICTWDENYLDRMIIGAIVGLINNVIVGILLCLFECVFIANRTDRIDRRRMWWRREELYIREEERDLNLFD